MGGLLIFVGIMLLALGGLIALVVTGVSVIRHGPIALREAADEMRQQKMRSGLLRDIKKAEAELAVMKRNWKDRVDEGRKPD